jgi:hypothetical protein
MILWSWESGQMHFKKLKIGEFIQLIIENIINY